MKIVLLGAVATLLVGAAAYEILTWPRVGALARDNPPSTAFIERYQSQQRRAGRSDQVAWHWVPEDRISPNLKVAVIVAEDIGFFTHHGFDVGELQLAVRKALQEGRARGASTITQQLAKNLWLSPSRNPLRKLKEALLTRQLESRLSKRRILELYLNVVEFGPGVYGAEAAARRYFGKPALDLTPHEAALLAASLPRPATWNPGSQSRAYRLQVARIEERMARATFVWRRIGGATGTARVLPVDSLLLDSLLRTMLAESLPPDSPAAGGTRVLDVSPGDSSARGAPPP